MSKYDALKIGHIVAADALQQAGAVAAHTLPGGRYVNYIPAADQKIDGGAIALRRDEATFRQAKAALQGRRQPSVSKAPAQRGPQAEFKPSPSTSNFSGVERQNVANLRKAGLRRSAKLYQQELARRHRRPSRKYDGLQRNHVLIKQLEGLPRTRTMPVGQMLNGSPEHLMNPQHKKSFVTRAVGKMAKTALMFDPFTAPLVLAASRPQAPRPGVRHPQPAPA